MGEQQTKPEIKLVYTVTKRFRDAPEYRNNGEINTYDVGTDVSHFDKKRLDALVERGSVAVSEVVATEEVPEATSAESDRKQDAAASDSETASGSEAETTDATKESETKEAIPAGEQKSTRSRASSGSAKPPTP